MRGTTGWGSWRVDGYKRCGSATSSTWMTTPRMDFGNDAREPRRIRKRAASFAAGPQPYKLPSASRRLAYRSIAAEVAGSHWGSNGSCISGRALVARDEVRASLVELVPDILRVRSLRVATDNRTDHGTAIRQHYRAT